MKRFLLILLAMISASLIINAQVSNVGSPFMDVQGPLYLRGNVFTLNKASNNWITWATRNTSTSETTIDLSNINNVLISGNVGIGTLSPTKKLEVVSNGTGAELNFKYSPAYGNTYIRTADWSSNLDYNNNMIFGVNTANGNGIDVMTLRGDGSVGIGTTTPKYKLEVGTGALGFQFNHATQTIGGQFGDGGQLNLTGGNPDGSNSGATLVLGGSTRGDGLKNGFYFISGSTGNIQMLIDGDYTGHTAGNVGIGTTSPDTKLDVIGKAVFGSANISGASYNEGLSIHNSTGENTSLLLWQHGIASGKIGFISNDNKLRIVNTFTDGSLSNSAAIVLDATGNVGIGTTNPGEFKLAVAGKIHATEIQVDALPWPDFVFQKDYNLRTLAEVEAFVNQNQHLPDVPSEAQVATEGISLGEMNAILLQKIEELTLYTIEQQKQIDNLSKLESKINELEKIINQLNK